MTKARERLSTVTRGQSSVPGPGSFLFSLSSSRLSVQLQIRSAAQFSPRSNMWVLSFFFFCQRLVRAITLTSVEYCTGLEGELRVVLCLTRVHRLGFPASDTEKWRQSVNWRSSEKDYGTVQSEHQVCAFILSQDWNSRKGASLENGQKCFKEDPNLESAPAFSVDEPGSQSTLSWTCVHVHTW